MNNPLKNAVMGGIQANPGASMANPLGAVFSSFARRQTTPAQYPKQPRYWWSHGPLSGHPPMPPSGPQAMPLPYAPPQMMQPQMPQGMDWRQIMARRFPMGFGV